jgi:DNA-binding transcriptional regulator YiaG
MPCRVMRSPPSWNLTWLLGTDMSGPCHMLDPVTASSRSVIQLMQARALIASGESLRIRKAAGLSLVSVASSVGVDPSAIGRWERGQRVPRGTGALKYAQLISRLRVQLEASHPLVDEPADLEGGDAACPPGA